MSARVVYLVLSHHLPEQLSRLLDRLVGESGNAFVVVHHDRRQSRPPVRTDSAVHVLADSIPTARGDLSTTRATLAGLRWIDEHLAFDWVILLSGQDYPVMALPAVEDRLQRTSVAGFVEPAPPDEAALECAWRYRRRHYALRVPFRARRRLAFSIPWNLVFHDGFRCHKASEWWMLSRDVTTHLLDFLQRTPRYWRQYERSHIPCESFLQTVVLNGPHRIDHDSRRFVRWSTPGARHPDTLTTADFDTIVESGAWFARKVHPVASADLLDRLDAHRGRDLGTAREAHP